MLVFNFPGDFRNFLYIRPVSDGGTLFKQRTDPTQGGFSSGLHLYQLGQSHHRPNNRRKVPDEFHQLSGIEKVFMNQIAAITQNHADDRFYKQGDTYREKGGEFRVVNICPFIGGVELAEGQQLLGFPNKGLDDCNARKAFLGKVR